MNQVLTEMPAVDRFGTPYFYFSNDIDNQITYLSESVEEILGYRASQHIGSSFMEFLVPTHIVNAKVVELHHARFQSTGQQNVVRAVRDTDGNERVLSVQTYGEAGTDGKVVRSRGCARDITRHYRQFEHLYRAHAELLDRTTRLNHREREVLRMIANGCLNKQIAKALKVSSRTVESTRRRVVDLLGVDHIAGAIAIESQLTLLNDLMSKIMDRSSSFSVSEFLE